MTERLTLLTRRVLLGLATIAPFALLAGRSGRARAQEACIYPDDPFFENDEVKKAGDKLWEAFFEGTADKRFFFTTQLDSGLKKDRTAHHGYFLCKKWESVYLKNPAKTEECARMAGRLAETLRDQEGTPKITKPQFIAAAEAVKTWQAQIKAAGGEGTELGGVC